MVDYHVSIVSIQADQSRLHNLYVGHLFDDVFQSYQFRQINPDDEASKLPVITAPPFQSYQFRQINPDKLKNSCS